MSGKRPRDSYWRRFYDAEQEMCSKTPELAFSDDDDAQAFLNRMLRSKWWRDNIKPEMSLLPHVEIVNTRADWWCEAMWHPTHAVIELPRDRSHPIRLLHMIAHQMQPHDSSLHGNEFGSLMVSLTQRWLGVERRRQFKQILIEHKVKTKVVSVEAKAKSRERWYKTQAPKAHQNLRSMIEDLEGLGDDH